MAVDSNFRGIGLVGLGAITRAHRAGYHRMGLPVVAGYDPSPEARQRFAEVEPQAVVHDHLDALLADASVGVVDLATPHHREARVPPIEAIAAAHKPVFIQKPLAMNYDEALHMADALRRADVPAMVNQNMCFTPGALALAEAVCARRLIGEPIVGQVELRIRFDCDTHPWFGKDQRWWTIGHTVHHLSVLHMVFGPPTSVYALMGRDPYQPGVSHDGYGRLSLTYPNDMHIIVLSTGTYYGVEPIAYAEERAWFQGTEGIIDWQPTGGYTLSPRADKDCDDPARRHQRVDTPGAWFPDAFGLAMHHFQHALAAGTEPWCSVADNLYVMAVIEAAYRSSAERRPVTLSEIMGDRYDASYSSGYAHGDTTWCAPQTSHSTGAAT